MGFICLYEGRRGECVECGGWAGPDPLDGRFCSADCADSYAANLTRIEESDRLRRQAEDDFAAEVARLSSAGYSYEEIDTILEDMP